MERRAERAPGFAKRTGAGLVFAVLFLLPAAARADQATVEPPNAPSTSTDTTIPEPVARASSGSGVATAAFDGGTVPPSTDPDVSGTAPTGAPPGDTGASSGAPSEAPSGQPATGDKASSAGNVDQARAAASGQVAAEPTAVSVPVGFSPISSGFSPPAAPEPRAEPAVAAMPAGRGARRILPLGLLIAGLVVLVAPTYSARRREAVLQR